MIYIAIFLSLILQFVIAPFIAIGAARINFLLITMTYIALFKKRAAIPCVICGVASGILTRGAYNSQWIFFAISGLTLAMVKDKFYKENALCQAIIMFLVSGFVYTCEYLTAGGNIHPKIVAYSAIYTAVVSPLLFRAFAVGRI